MWKCVKLKSFICLLSFCNAPSSQDLHMFIILNAFYEILMSTSETRNDEAVLFIIIKKNLTKISFVSSRFWIVVVHYTWTEAWTMTDCCGAQLKVQEMGKKKGYFRYRSSLSEKVTLFNMVQIINKLSHILYLFLSTKANKGCLLFCVCFFFFSKKLNYYTKLDYTEN